MTGAELLFVSKVLAWRLEKAEQRVVCINFTSFGVSAYLHNDCRDCKVAYENDVESVIAELNELEKEFSEC